MRAKAAAARRSAPNVYKAFRTLVYRHGVENLAPLLSLSVGTLYNKADAGEETHNQPTLRDVVTATAVTGDFEVIDALAETFDRAYYDCSRHAQASDEALLELLTNVGAESGEFHTALAAGLRAKRFSRDAARKVRAEAFDVISAYMTLLNRLEDFIDEDAPGQ